MYKNAKRNLLDIDDAIKIILYFLNKNIKNKVINVRNNQFTKPKLIVEILEEILQKKANYQISKKKLLKWKIVNNVNAHILKESKVVIKKNYLKKILKKYYYK